MKIGSFDTDQRVFIIAEIGNNHEGDFERAKDMVAAAAQAGVDAVKFQTIVPERLVSCVQVERIAQLTRFRFSHEQFAKLAETAAKASVAFLSTPFDLESARFLAPLVPAIKIASSDNTFHALLDVAVASGKPVLLSSGLCGEVELRVTIDQLRRAWGEDDLSQRLAVLHCVSAYPTPLEQANLGAVRSIGRLGVTPGYSDHTLGTEAAVLSVACGARVIEKHFTLDKQLSSFRDHQLSADPDGMAEMVRRVRQAEAMLGSGRIACEECEAGNKTALRRSIVAAVDCAAGTKLGPEHLDWVRPGGGLPPGSEGQLLGRSLTRAVKRGEWILPHELQG